MSWTMKWGHSVQDQGCAAKRHWIESLLSWLHSHVCSYLFKMQSGLIKTCFSNNRGDSLTLKFLVSILYHHPAKTHKSLIKLVPKSLLLGFVHEMDWYYTPALSHLQSWSGSPRVAAQLITDRLVWSVVWAVTTLRAATLWLGISRA